MNSVNKIKILPDSLMKRIAAGEVVERPASVVKELMENSLDAGADRIHLLVKSAGIDQIQVIDNGEGMPEEDVLICCEQHATSKIRTQTDLESITTLGFRGEALPSIASVSRMRIVSKTENDTEATQIDLTEGKLREVRKTAAKDGTTVTVKDLFYNVPARRKFLKQPATELRHIIATFRNLALSYSEIEFALFVDGEKTLALQKEDLKERMQSLLGGQFVPRMIDINKALPGLKIEGFISRPGEGRKSRGDQIFYLNRRYIVNRSLVHGVLSAYGPRLGRDEHPVYILFFEMDPTRFDVNVHPTKIEVRFSDEKYVHDSLHRVIKEALQSSQSVPELQLVSGTKKTKTFREFRKSDSVNENQLTFDAQRPCGHDNRISFQNKLRELPSLWQIHNRYILSQIKSGLTIIDQHVAHERILYERALKSREDTMALSQQLLFPQTVDLTADDFLTLEEIQPFLEKIGFGIKIFGGNTIIIEAVPVEVKTGNERKLLIDIIDDYKESKQKTNDPWDVVAKSFACKSAIKAGEKLEFQEMATLIDRLFATEEPFYCPHGRPVVINLSLEEIDKRFGR